MTAKGDTEQGSFETVQEDFWSGQFGNDYIDRNSDPASIGRRAALFARILRLTRGVSTVLELGANIGLNLRAIACLIPSCAFTAVEINAKAAKWLQGVPNTKVHNGSLLQLPAKQLGVHDLTFVSGVLIHIDPERLVEAYSRLYECSRTYILINEYYNPTPVEVAYRGHSGRLFKRDFAGEMLDRYRDLELIDYGFQYHRDPVFPLDDLTWFLLRKRERQS